MEKMDDKRPRTFQFYVNRCAGIPWFIQPMLASPTKASFTKWFLSPNLLWLDVQLMAPATSIFHGLARARSFHNGFATTSSPNCLWEFQASQLSGRAHFRPFPKRSSQAFCLQYLPLRVMIQDLCFSRMISPKAGSVPSNGKESIGIRSGTSATMDI